MRLDKLANLALVILSLVVIADIVDRRIKPSPIRASGSGSTRAAARAVYSAGEPFAAPPNFNLKTDRSSLLLIVRDGCRYCDASLPFYKRMVTEARAKGVRTELVGVCTNPLDVCTSYFRQGQVNVDRVVSVQPRALKISGTPTLVLVGQGGKVASIWVGELSESRQQEVLKTLLQPI